MVHSIALIVEDLSSECADLGFINSSRNLLKFGSLEQIKALFEEENVEAPLVKGFAFV